MRFIIISFLVLFAKTSVAAVWQDKVSWDDHWEKQYSSWVETNWIQEIFTDEESPYFGIPTDCADASYAMRAIYAFENKLPFAVTDPTKNSKNPISNRMKRWDKKGPEIERLKAFIAYLSMTLNTTSLPQDTVPVALDRDSLVPGIIYVKPRVHSYQIKKWSEQGIPVTLNSTTPYKVRTLHKYLSFPAYAPEDVRRFNDGYRRFKRPDELFKPTSSLPGYSLEQFKVSESLNFKVSDFGDYVVEKTHLVKETVKVKIRRLMFNLCFSAFHRVRVINEAADYYEKIGQKGRSCMNASEFDQYSTFSRDARLKEHFYGLKDYIEKTPEFQYEEPDSKSDEEYLHLKPYAMDIFTDDPKSFRRTRAQFVDFCTLEYKPETFLDLRQLWQRVKAGNLVQNPNTNRDWRWGSFSNEFQTSCPNFQEVH